jgi:threonyl-tRNA synthetase
LKWELNFIDNLQKASALPTDQIDVENAERYNIIYIDEQGEKKHPIILHCSPSGAIERCIYVLLEKAYKDKVNNKKPQLPLWLSPTQVRLIPITENHLKDCIEIAESLKGSQIRSDIDDRELTVANKIRQAEREWVPYIICFGEKEIKTKNLMVRKRAANAIEPLPLDTLMEEIKEKIGDKPFKQLSLPMLLSKRPTFIG